MVSALMEFCNHWKTSKEWLGEKEFSDFLKVLSPLAPHLTEELWSRADLKGLCCVQGWPKHDTGLVIAEKIIFIVQVNGKTRDTIEVNLGSSEEKIKKLALTRDKIKKWIINKEIKKTIFVPEKLINIVI